MARRRNEAVSAVIQRVEADAASRDAARIDVRGSVRQNLGLSARDSLRFRSLWSASRRVNRRGRDLSARDSLRFRSLWSGRFGPSDRRRPKIRRGAWVARRRGEAVSAAIQRADDDAASRDAARIDVRRSGGPNLRRVNRRGLETPESEVTGARGRSPRNDTCRSPRRLPHAAAARMTRRSRLRTEPTRQALRRSYPARGHQPRGHPPRSHQPRSHQPCAPAGARALPRRDRGSPSPWSDPPADAPREGRGSPRRF